MVGYLVLMTEFACERRHAARSSAGARVGFAAARRGSEEDSALTDLRVARVTARLSACCDRRRSARGFGGFGGCLARHLAFAAFSVAVRHARHRGVSGDFELRRIIRVFFGVISCSPFRHNIAANATGRALLRCAPLTSDFCLLTSQLTQLTQLK